MRPNCRRRVAPDTGRPSRPARAALYRPRCRTISKRLWFELADWAGRYGDGGIITMALAGSISHCGTCWRTPWCAGLQLIGGRAHRAASGLREPAAAALARGRRARIPPRPGCGNSRRSSCTRSTPRSSRHARGARRRRNPDYRRQRTLRHAGADRVRRGDRRLRIYWYEEPVRPMHNRDAIARMAAVQPLTTAPPAKQNTPR